MDRVDLKFTIFLLWTWLIWNLPYFKWILTWVSKQVSNQATKQASKQVSKQVSNLSE